MESCVIWLLLCLNALRGSAFTFEPKPRKVLVADKLQVQAFSQLPVQVIYEPTIDGKALANALSTHNPDVLVVRSTRVDASLMNACSTLKLIVRAGAGYDTIDVKAATNSGIRVSTCKGTNAIAVAELVFGLILASDRRIVENSLALHQGRWNKNELSRDTRGLYGRTLGILGVGSIGCEVIKRAAAFGMPCCVWSRSLNRGPRQDEEEGDALS